MRFSALLLVLIYAVTATPVAALAAAPRVKVVAKDDFPCARHGCACKTAEQCRKHCCCELKRPQPAPKICHLTGHDHKRGRRAETPRPVKVPVTVMASLECRGAPAPALGGRVMKPHLPAPVTGFSIPVEVSLLPRDLTHYPAAVVPDHPDKVPI